MRRVKYMFSKLNRSYYASILVCDPTNDLNLQFEESYESHLSQELDSTHVHARRQTDVSWPLRTVIRKSQYPMLRYFTTIFLHREDCIESKA